MMAYRDSYVVALLVDGKVQKESQDGRVLLPFGSEYIIRLKNKLRKRSVADIWIDGKVAAQGIVVDSNGTVDLERFVSDGNLSEGKKFKLVRVTDSKVDQPDDNENGVVEVNFYPEKDAPVVEKIVQHDYHYDYCLHHSYNWIGHCPQCCSCYSCKPKITWTTYGNGTATFGTCSNIGNTINLGDAKSVSPNSSVDSQMTSNLIGGTFQNSVFAVNASSPVNNLGEDAATVGGSTSMQKFSSINIDVDRSNPTTIRLTVKGISKIIDVCSCGFKRTKNVKYCPNDGNQLVA